ncbi:MAG TPA: hypothetical protein VHB21_04065 [Minicystis sp.]|nr:hypothetical protein [Minicystis sp.]
MGQRQTCIDCGKVSPETNSDHTLISAQYGWRVVKTDGEGGRWVMQWRCPTCWLRFKKARDAGTREGGSPPSSRRG